MVRLMSSPGAIAFQLGPIVVRWYGILMATAIVVGLYLGHREARKEGLPADDIISAGQWAILAGLVAFNWDYYGRFPSKILAVWEGGLAMHGGLIVGPIVGALLAARWKLPILRGLDIAAPCLVLGQAIGRWGNFFNEEAFGAPTNVPWKLYISPGHRPPGFTRFDFFHPTFLYESLWDLAVFIVLVVWLRHRLHRQPGALFFAYVGLYSVGRFLIESVRLESVLGVGVAIAGLAWTRRRAVQTGVAEPSPIAR